MALQATIGGGGAVEREAGGGGLADVVNTILDKGLVIDVLARVSVVGIELLRVDARVVVARGDTYLRFAEAASRLGVGASEPTGRPGLMEELQHSGSKAGAKGLARRGRGEARGDLWARRRRRNRGPAAARRRRREQRTARTKRS